MQDLVGALVWVLVALFLAGAAHKLERLRTNPADVPLFDGHGFMQAHARWFLLGASTAEVAVVIALIESPAFGFAIAVALLAVYGYFLLRMSPDAECDCFGRMFDEQVARAAFRRNVLFVLASAASECLVVFGGLEVRPMTTTTIATASLPAAALGGTYVLRVSGIPTHPLRIRLLPRR